MIRRLLCIITSNNKTPSILGQCLMALLSIKYDTCAKLNYCGLFRNTGNMMRKVNGVSVYGGQKLIKITLQITEQGLWKIIRGWASCFQRE